MFLFHLFISFTYSIYSFIILYSSLLFSILFVVVVAAHFFFFLYSSSIFFFFFFCLFVFQFNPSLRVELKIIFDLVLLNSVISLVYTLFPFFWERQLCICSSWLCAFTFPFTMSGSSILFLSRCSSFDSK